MASRHRPMFTVYLIAFMQRNKICCCCSYNVWVVATNFSISPIIKGSTTYCYRCQIHILIYNEVPARSYTENCSFRACLSPFLPCLSPFGSKTEKMNIESSPTGFSQTFINVLFSVFTSFQAACLSPRKLKMKYLNIETLTSIL